MNTSKDSLSPARFWPSTTPDPTSRKQSLPALLRFQSLTPSPRHTDPPPALKVQKTPRRVPLSSYALRVLQDDQKYKLTHKHQVLRAVSAVRDIVQGDNHYSAFKTSSFHRFSKGVRALGSSTTVKKPLAEEYLAQNEVDYKELESVNEVLKQATRVSRARKVMADANLETWMKHHGKEVVGAESRGFSEFLKNLFDALNEGNGAVTPKGLISHLISLGLADDPKTVITVFEGLFATSDLESVCFKKDQFISIFKVKKITDHIIRIMHKAVEDNDATHSGSPRPSARSTKMDGERVQWSYPSFTQFYGVVKAWWREVNKQEIEVVHVRKLSEFLASKAIVGNKHEGKRLIQSSGKLSEGIFVRFPHFVNIFAPAMLKTCLLNIARGMSSGAFTNLDSPLRLKMAAYERKLIFEGLKSPSPNSEEKMLFNAYCEYTKTLRSQHLKTIGRKLGVTSDSVTKSIPKIATDLDMDLRAASQIAKSQLFKDKSQTQRTPTPLSNPSTSEFRRTKSPSEAVTQTLRLPEVVKPKVRFKAKKAAYMIGRGSPAPNDERMLRDNKLYEHFSDMVNFSSEISEVLADCEVE